MTTKGIEIAHITIDGKEMDETTDIDKKESTTQKSSDVLRIFGEKKPIFIKFYANWCGHCKTIDKPWKELVKEVRTKYADKNIALVEVESKIMDGDIDKMIAQTKDLKVDGFPTIGMITYDNGKAVFTAYRGNRDKKGMLAAVEELVGKQAGGKHRASHKRKATRKQA
jgi:thiol-disulfide isomerase/thioredoxin